jgi:hypothetical protein
MPNPLAINPHAQQRAITSANEAFTRARLTALFSETAWYPKKKVTIEVAQTKGHAEPPPPRGGTQGPYFRLASFCVAIWAASVSLFWSLISA